MAIPSQPQSQKRVFIGSFVHSLSLRKLEYLRDTLLAVDENGVIAFVVSSNEEHDETQFNGAGDNGQQGRKRQGIKTEQDVQFILSQQGWELAETQVIWLKRGEFIIPGLIDTHTHAPQYPNLGRGQQYQLLDWLSNLTFPTEARFSDPFYAQRIYESVVARNIAVGTTTCCWYGTLHLEATKQLASILHERGQRCFVGKCNMDRNSALDYVEKGAAKSIEDTKEFVRYVRKECCDPAFATTVDDSTVLSPPLSPKTRTLNGTPDSSTATLPSSSSNGVSSPTSPRSRSNTSTSAASSGSKHHHHRSSVSSVTSTTSTARSQAARHAASALVQPILTPRFAISCSDALMAGLQAMVGKDPTLHIQTHLAENPAEIEFTKQLFPFADSYTQVYDHFGLLTKKTILAHCVHLEDSEMQLIKETRSGISHCPTSNLNLRSGCSPVAELLDKGIKVGLGTDVSGGFGLGILTAIREASVVSKVLSFSDSQTKSVSKDRGRSLTPKKSTLPSIEAAEPPAPTEGPDGTITPVRQTEADPETFLGKHLPLETLFYLATMGGAEVCDLQDRIGNFLVGKEFDALLITTGQKEEDFKGPNPFEDQPNPALFVEQTDPLEAIFEKFLFAGDDRNIASVFVRGRVIGGAKPLQ
ncbi:Metallo-dependent hydrolase [Cystobasidium minutum MCA 4210]|uniref:Metallo-dependent hydrolase n=1 Tax=Cystobasidium minutum MCA 4210 TaxID=1397322 RepID=UPI0034CEC79D|eukprot:jgi/Rhomi1/192875/gm1.1089_g